MVNRKFQNWGAKTKELKRQKTISKSHGTISKGIIYAHWEYQKKKRKRSQIFYGNYFKVENFPDLVIVPILVW